MRDYHVYPEAIETLDRRGLLDTIKERKLRYARFSSSDLPELLQDMSLHRWAAPKRLGVDYHARLQRAYERTATHPWIIGVADTERLEPVDEEDWPVLSGFAASSVLPPKDFWRFRRAGFESHGAFIGAVGALIHSADPHPKGYTWEATTDGKTFETKVSGSFHGDFRLVRTDVTQYPVISPLGFHVPYRPLLERRVVAASHSVEPLFLASLLQYAEQTGAPVRVGTREGAMQFLAEIASLPSLLGNFADAGDDAHGPRGCLWQLSMPLQRADERKSLGWHTLPLYASRGEYELLIGARNELVIRSPGEMAQEDITILPIEIDRLVEGLFVQASTGVGRTSVHQLREVLRYRYSEEFAEDKKQLQ